MKIEYLSQYCDIKKEIICLKEQIALLEEVAGETLISEYKHKCEQLYDMQLEIEKAIESLEPIERTLIRYRYFEGLKWDSVCRQISYSLRHTLKIHKRIIDKIQEL